MANKSKKKSIDSLEDIEISQVPDSVVDEPTEEVVEKAVKKTEEQVLDTVTEKIADESTKEITQEVVEDKPQPTIKKDQYTVECVGRDRVLLKKDDGTTKMIIGFFNYHVGDIIEL